LQEGFSFDSNRRDVGREHEVLVEGPSKKDASKLTGRTRTNKLVHFASDGSEAGALRTVRIDQAHSHHLEGSIVAGRSREPVRSMSLPLVTSTTSSCSGCA